jgi:hypothetical protein
MPKVYAPKRSYYGDYEGIFQSDIFYIFDVSENGIRVYDFFYQERSNLDTSLYYVMDATSFFSKELKSRDNQISQKPFIENQDKINMIRYKDVVDNISKYKLFTTKKTVMGNIDNVYLVPFGAYYIDFKSYPKNGIDPNINMTLFVDNFVSRDKFFPERNQKVNNSSTVHGFENLDFVTKPNLDNISGFRRGDIIVLNSGYGGNTLTTFENIDLIIPTGVSKFMSNVDFTDDLIKDPNSHSFYPKNKLRFKVSGPSSGSVGDILEYTVTLMNYDFSDTWTNPPDVECYPSTDAGNLLHRKIILKNGVGKFKIDTSNLYSGETFNVKVGWKYITSDSKVSVTLS